MFDNVQERGAHLRRFYPVGSDGKRKRIEDDEGGDSGEDSDEEEFIPEPEPTRYAVVFLDM